jgi:TRAP-type C4-dicarboxylate transport system substrate-binding protein
MTNRKIDWQKLAKNLQKALEKEIDESEQHRKWCLEWREKYDKLDEDCKKEIVKLKSELNMSAIRGHKLKGIIEYLEDKIGNNPV